MPNDKEDGKQLDTEVRDGFTAPKGSFTNSSRRNLSEEGVEPQDSTKALSVCKNNACKMEIMNGIDRCPYCNARQ